MTAEARPTYSASPDFVQAWVTRELSRLRGHLEGLRQRRAGLLAHGAEAQSARVELGIARQLAALDRQVQATEAQHALLDRLSGLLAQAQSEPAASEKLARFLPGRSDLGFSFSSLDHALSRHRALAQRTDELAVLLGGFGDSTRVPELRARVRERVLIARVLDGDTVVLADDRRVRYLGLDIPELKGHFGRPQPFAQEAADANRLQVEGQCVWLEQDVSDEDGDAHLLRHVLIDERCVGVDLVAAGLARALPLYPDLSRADELLGAERDARQAQRGLWSV